VQLGRHEFDGQIADLSAEGWAREVERLHKSRERALAIDVASLSKDDRYERALLLSDVANDLFWIERARGPWRNCMSTFSRVDPGVYVLRPYAALDERARALARYARNLPRAIAQIRGVLERPLPLPHANTCAEVYDGLAEFLAKDAPAAFTAVHDGAIGAELAAALGPASAAAREFAAWFRGQADTATGSFALGALMLEEMVRSTEGMNFDVETLQAMARRDLDANLAALREACASFAPGNDLSACVASANAHQPPSGPIARATEQLVHLRSRVQEAGLVTIPGPEEALVVETPAYARWNAAWLDTPGPFDRGVPAFYYVTPPDPSWSPEERQAYVLSEANLLLVSIHEVWPGHFLQWQHQIRARWPLARAVQSYAFVEGWGHYAEQLMWQVIAGGAEPELHVGQIQEALLRDVRFLSAVGLHAKGMTVEESARLFRELAFQDPATARQQARRGTFDPAYLNYTLGKLLIVELREAYTRTRGGRQAWHEFHDRLLGLGAPPLPIARAMLLGEPLP
jgi:hypothetical protein